MNNENKYQFINNLPKEYHRVLWNIMIKAECNHFVEFPEKLSKQECKLIMRFLYKIFDKIKELEQENKQLKEDWFTKIIREMIKNQYTITNLGKVKIVRQPSTLTTFNFSISFNKSLFKDLLSEEEKAMIWLEGEKENES